MSDQLDFLDGFERDLVEAARRRRDARTAARVARLRERLGLRRAGLAALLVVLVGAATAGATFAVLRASVIPGPTAHDVPRDQLPAPGSARVSELRAPDPVAGRPPWTLRLARSSTGLLCSTVGQLAGGEFGLVGLDGRFRSYSPRVVDSCGAQVSGPHASLVGARVFDADEPRAVRTLVNGVGGDQLRSATVVARSSAQRLALGAGGTFLAALRGYPEDNAVEVVLRFADGTVERHGFGRSPWVVTDPDGGPAWKLEAGNVDGDMRTCVSFSPARGRGVPRSPGACGAETSLGGLRDRYFFALRRLEPGDGGPRSFLFGGGSGDWGEHPPRTAIWGAAGRDVARIEIDGAPGGRRTLVPNNGRTFLAVFGPQVDPAALTVRVVLAGGRIETHHGDANIVDRRIPRR